MFSSVGPAPLPAGDAGWRWEGQTGRNKASVEFPASVPAASKVWFCALYYNAKGENGPACSPVSCYLQMEDAQETA